MSKADRSVAAEQDDAPTIAHERNVWHLFFLRRIFEDISGTYPWGKLFSLLVVLSAGFSAYNLVGWLMRVRSTQNAMQPITQILANPSVAKLPVSLPDGHEATLFLDESRPAARGDGIVTRSFVVRSEGDSEVRGTGRIVVLNGVSSGTFSFEGRRFLVSADSSARSLAVKDDTRLVDDRKLFLPEPLAPPVDSLVKRERTLIPRPTAGPSGECDSAKFVSATLVLGRSGGWSADVPDRFKVDMYLMLQEMDSLWSRDGLRMSIDFDARFVRRKSASSSHPDSLLDELLRDKAVIAWRDSARADLVLALASFGMRRSDKDGNGTTGEAGIAYLLRLNDRKLGHMHADATFAIIDSTVLLSMYSSGSLVAAHEIGHLLGVSHPRRKEEKNLRAAFPQFGYGYYDEQADVGDIMTGGSICWGVCRQRYYSSPDREVRARGRTVALGSDRANAKLAINGTRCLLAKAAELRGLKPS